MRKNRAIVFGCGYWGKNIIRCLSAIPSVTIVGVCDTNDKALIQYRDKYRCFSSIGETLDVDYDIGFVITRANSHFELCKTLLENKKHVFVEKPMTTTYSDAIYLRILADEHSRILCVDHTFLFSPEISVFKRLVEHNIDDIRLIESSRVNKGPIMTDIDVIMDLCPHDFSILNYIVPFEPSYISCHTMSVFGKNAEKSNILVHYKDSELKASICVSWLENNKSRNFKIMGRNLNFEYDSATNKQATLNGGEMSIEKNHEPLLLEITHFIECCQNNVKSKLIDAEHGIKVMELISKTRL